jgi:hydrogenase-4 component F
MLILVSIPLAAALACLAVRNTRVHEYVTLGGTAAMCVLAAGIVREVLRGGTLQALGGLLYMDALSSYLLMVIVLLSFVTSVYSIEYMRDELAGAELDAKGVRYYYVLYNLFVFTMAIVPISNNLAVLWIAIEGTTLVSALLVGIYRKRESIEAAWKYIILCTVGITFALLGTFIIYYASSGAMGGGRGALEWTTLTAISGSLNPATVRLAFILVIIGYGTKAGLAPVHNWLPDAHSEAPTPISALLSGILLNCAFYGIMRFAVIAGKTCGHAFVQDVMFLFGLASIIMASIFMLIQTNSKRLLAYSSIENMGIISLGFGAGGFFGIYASLLHILNHAVGKPLMFFVTGRIRSTYHSVETGEVTGVLKCYPLVGALGFAGVMALAGVPPFSMFLSKFLLLRGLADGGHWYVLGAFLLASVLVFYGLLKSFGGMFLGAPPARAQRRRGFRLADPVLICLGAALLVLGLYIPDALDRLITMSVTAAGG